MAEIKVHKFPKPKSYRICKCGRGVFPKFCRMAIGYQAWGHCLCGRAHSFEEYLKEDWWNKDE